jgi:F0F1-type ATP synthase assembly protein I
LNIPPDDRSALARAMELGTLTTTIALEMVLPGAAGYWLDQRLGTTAVFTIVGAVLGFSGGLWHLIRLVGELSRKSEKDGDGGTTTPSPGETNGGAR